MPTQIFASLIFRQAKNPGINIKLENNKAPQHFGAGRYFARPEETK